MTEEASKPKLSIPLDLNTVLILVVAVGGFWYMNRQNKQNVVPPGPAPAPVVQLNAEDSAQLAASCDVMAIAVSTDGLFSTTRDIGEAWRYTNVFAFGTEGLSPAAEQWTKTAEVRIQRALGQTGAEASKPLNAQLRLAAAQEFQALAEDLR